MKTKLSAERTMTTKEVAKTFGVSAETVRSNGKALFPTKKTENGKPIFWTETESKLILERIRANNAGSAATSKGALEVITSDLTPALMIKQAMELAQKGYELELKRIAAEKESLKIQLDRSKEWYSIKRMEKLNEGQHFDWRVLKAESEKMGIEVKKVFDANYGEVNAYHVSVWESLYFDTLDYGE